MKNLMLDIETLGLGSNALVVAIGAVFFDPKTGEIGNEFYRVLDYQDQIDKGRVPTLSTVKFWFGQSEEARAVFLQDGVPTSQALRDFYTFVTSNCEIDKVTPWGNGPSFDLTITESLMNDFSVPIPWKFRNVRCLRTFKDYIYDGKDLKREGVYHHALDDCKHQIRVVCEGVKRNASC